MAFAGAAFALRASEMPGIVEATAALGREPIKGLLALLLGWVRDLMLASTAGEGARIANVDYSEAIFDIVRRAPAARLDGMVRAIEEAAELLERNVHSVLLLSTLAHALHGALHGDRREGVHAPLTG